MCIALQMRPSNVSFIVLEGLIRDGSVYAWKVLRKGTWQERGSCGHWDRVLEIYYTVLK